MPPIVDDPLFFLDYDGTLAPIVDDPMQAYPHPEVPELLEKLEAHYPVWIVTGRYLKDLSTFFDRPLRAIGLHGIQQGTVGGEIESLISAEAQEALAQMRASVPELEGLNVESKGPTFAVHYRTADDEEAARTHLQEWVANLPDVLDPIWGKKVVELRPKGSSKGIAVRRIAETYPERTPLYLGDDVTDEDAFEVLGDDGVTIKVGTGETQARYRLSDVDAVVGYLKQYV